MSITASEYVDSSSRQAKRRTSSCSPPSGPHRQTRSGASRKIAHHNPIGVPFRIEISSMPITRGLGVPALASCARMYCISSSLTVSQSSLSSCAMSLMVPAGSVGPRNRQSAWCRMDCPPETPVARASRCRSSGTGRAGPRPPDRCGVATGKSRTRRTRRSYQPKCTRPQLPQTVFLTVAPTAILVPWDHRRLLAHWITVEIHPRRTCPTTV